MPTVSIVIPVYNVEPYIERCIRSVISQTYTNIECIIVDDCTRDQSMHICEQIIKDYHGPIKFNILSHTHNRGLSAARNTGTKTATGEYIFYLDSDDEITPDCISLLVEEVMKHPGIEMVCGGVSPADKVYTSDNFQFFTSNIQIKLQYLLPSQKFPITAWNKLISLDYLKRSNITFKEGILHEDVLWTFHTIQHLSYVVMLPSPTYCYTIRENSITSMPTNMAARANSMMIVFEEIANAAHEPYYLLSNYKFIERLLEWFPYTTTKNAKVFLSYIRNLTHLKQYKDAAALTAYRIIGCFSRNNRITKRIQQHFSYRYHYESQQVQP